MSKQLPTVTYRHGIYQKVIDQTTIKAAVNEVANYIINMYQCLNESPVLLGVLNGAIYFMTDLHRTLQAKGLEAHIDTIAAQSYHKPGEQGNVTISKEPKLDLTNRFVIIVEDIVDTGKTAHAIRNHVSKLYHCETLEIVALVKRISAIADSKQKIHNVKDIYSGIRYRGDEWLVGYGFDDDEAGRALPDIYKRIEMLT
jgi:hypoxanthine phosphoribosyltransferase